jgi:hypothetical protein
MQGIKRKGTILTVDLSQWYTQQQYAALKGMRLNTLSQWIRREQAGQKHPGKIAIYPVPELNNLVLVRDAENTGE